MTIWRADYFAEIVGRDPRRRGHRRPRDPRRAGLGGGGAASCAFVRRGLGPRTRGSVCRRSLRPAVRDPRRCRRSRPSGDRCGDRRDDPRRAAVGALVSPQPARERRGPTRGAGRRPASGISTSTSRSAPTAAGTATSSPSSAARRRHARLVRRCAARGARAGAAARSARPLASVFVGGGTPTFTESGRAASAARRRCPPPRR